MKIKFYFPSFFLILLFHASFVTFPYWEDYNKLKYLIVLVVGIFLVFNIKTFLNKKYMTINIVLLLYLAVTLFSSFINRHNVHERNVFLVAILYSLVLIEVFMLFEYFSINNRTAKLISILYYLTLFYVILTDFLLIIKPHLYIEKGMYYLIGNKFAVSYLHLQLIVLYIQKVKLINKNTFNRSIIVMLYSLLTLIICFKVDCSTGIIGLVVLLSVVIFSGLNKTIFKKPQTILITLLVFCSILLVFPMILKTKFISHIIVDFLGEDLTLSFRMIIYDKVPKLLSKVFMFGTGLGSSFEVMTKYMHAPNTQNGMLECILEQGVIATFLLLVLIFFVFKHIEKSKGNISAISMIYVYAVLASVEITLNQSFIIWLAIAMVCSDAKIFENKNNRFKLVFKNHSRNRF